MMDQKVFKNKFFIKTLILVFFILFLAFPSRDIANIVRFRPLSEKNFYNVKLKGAVPEKAQYSIADLTYQDKKIPGIIDSVISFNKPAKRLWKDDTGNYKIRYADYIFAKGKGGLGTGCAKFFKKSHRVEIVPERDLWLGSCEDLGSFTIEFRFSPLAVIDKSMIFSRVGYFSGSKRGIEVLIDNGRLVCHLHDLFIREDGTRTDVSLNMGRSLKKGEWYHFALSFNRITGKLTKYINGEEDEAVYVTRDGNPFDGVQPPYFGHIKNGLPVCHDAPLAVIGGNFTGYIDEFRISYKNFQDLKKRTEIARRNYHDLEIMGRTPYNIEGVVMSPVYNFSRTGTKVLSFDWDEKIADKTFIFMEFRICDHLFYEDDTKIKWYRVRNGQRNIFLMKGADKDLLRGKYYQWRAHLIASPDGKYSPRLSNIRLRFQPDLPPPSPRFPEIVETGDRYIVLRWKKDVDFDIRGYRIYYGVRPDRCDGILTHIKSREINNKTTAGDYIKVRLTNKIIEENRNRDKSNLLSYPLIKNTVLYFFSVSAYDSYKPGTPYNHESELSKQVSGRPFAGSEID